MLFDPHKYADSVENSHILHVQVPVQVHPVSRPLFVLSVEDGSNFAQGDVATSNDDFGILKKQTEQR